MISYDSKNVINLLYRYRGSILPVALTFAVPAGVLAALTKYCHNTYFPDWDFTEAGGISNTYNSVLGFLLVFRCQVAWGRFWDGASHLQVIKGGWLNAVSNLMSFCSEKPEMQAEVQRFQHQLCRLMSMMYSSALIIVSEGSQDFDILSYEGLDRELVQWAADQHDRLEIIMQWVQKLIVDKHRSKVINIDPPILSRVFQELSNGMIEANNAKRINRFPFPFPYAQMISVMLCVHLLANVVIGGLSMNFEYTAFLYALVSTFSVWSINFIAIEIEAPFGTDDNDLPLESLQESFNDSLVTLLQPQTRTPPDMEAISEEHLNVGLSLWKTEKDRRLKEKGERMNFRYFTGETVAEYTPSYEEKAANDPIKPVDANLDLGAAKDIVRAQHSLLETLLSQIDSHHQDAAMQFRHLLESNREICRALRSGPQPQWQRAVPVPITAVPMAAHQSPKLDVEALLCRPSLVQKAVEVSTQKSVDALGKF